jgi:uncharacterized membrane protein
MLVRAATKTGAFNVIGECSRYAIERREQAMADFTSDPHGNTAGPAPSPEATDAGGHKPRPRPNRHVCSVCGRDVPAREITRLDVVRPAIIERIREEKPDLPAHGFICRSDLGRFRSNYVAQMLTRERGELTQMEEDVVKSLADHETLAANIEAEFAERRTVGERLSDRLASFGGSWTFITLFFVALLIWMVFNIVVAARSQFDPYPFILLNLVLSCLAAIQAPIIMMSQKRQEAKDRLRSENDYRVNLKAELEIRHLHEKIDHILTRQWERLAEIQEIQLEMMQDLPAKTR